jgi:hypothetical protein
MYYPLYPLSTNYILPITYYINFLTLAFFNPPGTILAMANALGMCAVGVELSPHRCRKAAQLEITPDILKKIAPHLRYICLGGREEARERRREVTGMEKEDILCLYNHL